MLQAALAMSVDQEMMHPPATAPPASGNRAVDISAMTEEEQIAYAMQMSMETTPARELRTPVIGHVVCCKAIVHGCIADLLQKAYLRLQWTRKPAPGTSKRWVQPICAAFI